MTQGVDTEQQAVTAETLPPRVSRIHMRGFASQTRERRRELASLGGKAAHRLGTAHEWTPEEAALAGKRGGAVSRRRPRRVGKKQEGSYPTT